MVDHVYKILKATLIFAVPLAVNEVEPLQPLGLLLVVFVWGYGAWRLAELFE